MRSLDITTYGARTLEGPLPAAVAVRELRDAADRLHAAWAGDDPPTMAARRDEAYRFAVLACELLTGTRPIDRADALFLLGRTPGLPEAAQQAVLSGLNPRPQCRRFPRGLVGALEAVPDAAWPGVPEVHEVERDGGTGAAEGDAPAAVVIAHPTTLPPTEAVEEPPYRRGFLRRLGPYVAALCVLAVPASAGTGAWMLGLLPASRADGAAGASLAVESAALTVTPPTTHCPQATVQLDTSLVTNGEAGTLRLVFWLPGGNRLRERTVHVEEGQTVARAIAQITVAGDVKLKGSASVTVHPGGQRAWAPFRFDC